MSLGVLGKLGVPANIPGVYNHKRR